MASDSTGAVSLSSNNEAPELESAVFVSLNEEALELEVKLSMMKTKKLRYQ